MIIGAGAAGLTAAIYGVRAGYSVKVLEQNIYGGQIITTAAIDNYPGLPGVNGPDLAGIIHNQATDLGAEIVYGNVVAVDLEGAVKKVTLQDQEILAKSVILATGAHPIKLGCPGEDTFSGAGVSYCATCDGAFYRGRDVVVIGGGNTAIEDAIQLSGTSNKVYLVHRRDQFRAEKHLLRILQGRENVVWLTDSVVEEIVGENTVTGVQVKNLLTGEQQLVAVNGVFVAIGSAPNNQLFAPSLQLDPTGYIVADESCITNLPGVFVAGDTRTKKVRQIVTATADGAVAALAAGEYLSQQEQ